MPSNGATTANAVMTDATGDPNRVQIAFIPGGLIRDPLAVSPPPNISFADLYNVLPLGGDRGSFGRKCAWLSASHDLH